jgi:hypothetical protein
MACEACGCETGHTSICPFGIMQDTCNDPSEFLPEVFEEDPMQWGNEFDNARDIEDIDEEE